MFPLDSLAFYILLAFFIVEIAVQGLTISLCGLTFNLSERDSVSSLLLVFNRD